MSQLIFFQFLLRRLLLKSLKKTKQNKKQLQPEQTTDVPNENKLTYLVMVIPFKKQTTSKAHIFLLVEVIFMLIPLQSYFLLPPHTTYSYYSVEYFQNISLFRFLCICLYYHSACSLHPTFLQNLSSQQIMAYR